MKTPVMDIIAMSRRSFLLSCPGFAVMRRAGANSGPRLVTLDDGLAQTLIAVGAKIVATAQVPNWSVWTIEPALPPGVANIGLAREPNMESLLRVKPDRILSTPYLEGIRIQISQIAPVESFPIHALDRSPYPNIIAATRRLGAIADRRDAAEALIERTEAMLETARNQLSGLRKKPLVFLHFLDARHVRVYGRNGIIQDTLDRLGLYNGWTGRTNAWGFATIGIERLAETGDCRVLVFDPVPPDVWPRLAGSPVWQSLLFVRAGRVHRFPNVHAFGTLPAVIRLTRLLSNFETANV